LLDKTNQQPEFHGFETTRQSDRKRTALIKNGSLILFGFGGRRRRYFFSSATVSGGCWWKTLIQIFRDLSFGIATSCQY
jgi:hypothetical protein